MPAIKCLHCNLPSDQHTQAMRVVANGNATPVPGFRYNLRHCIDRGGPKLPRQSGQLQQGEGRHFSPQNQQR